MSVDLTNTSGTKILTLRRADRCSCGTELAAGQKAAWDRSTRVVRCLDCAGASIPLPDVVEALDVVAEPIPIRLGVAGGSAQREYERRHDRRRHRVRTAHPRIGGLLLALSEDPQSTTAWRSGAAGERRVGVVLAALGDAVIALHDRAVPRSRANIDHIVVGPAGVHVIDAKRYKDAKIGVRRTGGILNPVREQLIVGGRDKTGLVTAMGWQVAAVRDALATRPEFADVPVTAVLCFIDANFPLFGTVDVNGVQVRGPGGTTKIVSAAGPFDAAMRTRIARHLASALPAK